MKLYQQVILIIGAIIALILSAILKITIIPVIVIIGIAIALITFLVKNKLKEAKYQVAEEVTDQDKENLRLNILDLKYDFFETREISSSPEKSKELLELILDTKFDKKSIDFFYHLTKKARQSYDEK